MSAPGRRPPKRWWPTWQWQNWSNSRASDPPGDRSKLQLTSQRRRLHAAAKGRRPCCRRAPCSGVKIPLDSLRIFLHVLHLHGGGIDGAVRSEAAQIFAVLAVDVDARFVELGAVAFGDQDFSGGQDREAGGLVEGVIAHAALAGLAELQQHLAVGRELDDLLALAVLGLEVGRPDIAVLVDGDGVE